MPTKSDQKSTKIRILQAYLKCFFNIAVRFGAGLHEAAVLHLLGHDVLHILLTDLSSGLLVRFVADQNDWYVRTVFCFPQVDGRRWKEKERD